MSSTSRAQVAELLDAARDRIAAVGRAQQLRAQLTATADAGGGRVAVTVNADGVVIDVRFADDIADLDYADIAESMLAAAQAAAAAVARRSEEVMRPVRQLPPNLPGLPGNAPGVADMNALRALLPRPPAVSTARPQPSGRGDGRELRSAATEPTSAVRDQDW